MKKQGLIAIIILALVVIGIFMFGTDKKEIAVTEPVNIPEQESAIEKPEAIMENEKNIVEIAVSNPKLSTLVTAVTEADLVETLSGEGPFTVFAPTDDAFAKIPEETLNEILADKEQLTAILTYHVIAGKVMAPDLVKLTSAETIQGGEVSIEVTGNEVMINNAKVIVADVEASNGVIHVIDTVLIPQ